MAFATAYYHWFFLIQPFDLPERLIGADPVYYLRRKIGGWGSGPFALRPARARRVRAMLQRSRDDPRDVRGLSRGGVDRSRARCRGCASAESNVRCSRCGERRASSIGCSIRSPTGSSVARDVRGKRAALRPLPRRGGAGRNACRAARRFFRRVTGALGVAVRFEVVRGFGVSALL